MKKLVSAMLLAFMAGMVNAADVKGGPDLSSAEKLWDYFIVVMNEGNLEKALNCFTNGPRRRFSELFTDIGPEGMKGYVFGISKLEKMTTYNEVMSSYVATRPGIEKGEKQAVFVTIVCNDGNCRINNM